MHVGNHIITLLSMFFVFNLATCTTKKTPRKLPGVVKRTSLKVAPYPYIPDSVNDQFKSLLGYMKNEFEAVHPTINLTLRQMNTNDDFYNLSTLSQWLANNGTGYDVIEIDTVLLGGLVDAGLVAPILSPLDKSDWHPASASVVQFNGAVYGYPHIMCSTFLFTREDAIVNVTTIDELVRVLGNTSTTEYRLVGNLNSSWDLTSHWISSYQGSSENQFDVTAAAIHAYETGSLDSLRKLARLCDRIGQENDCLSGKLQKKELLPARLFAKKKAKAMFGYSERLYYVLSNNTSNDYHDVKIIPLPSGTRRNHAVLATDAYVFRRNMSKAVRNAALQFVKFMATPRMQAAVVGSGDSPNRNTIPRYVLPISKSAYDHPLLKENRFYQKYFRNLTGFSLPPLGFGNLRHEIEKYVLNGIK